MKGNHYDVLGATRLAEDVAFDFLPSSQPTMEVHHLLEHRRYKNNRNDILYETLTVSTAKAPPVLWSTDVPEYELGTHPELEKMLISKTKEFLKEGTRREIDMFLKGGTAAIQHTIYDV